MKILFIGDIIAKAGRRLTSRLLPEVVEKQSIDFIIANGENSAGGNGITPKVARELFSLGVDVITTGNHVWDKKEVLEIMGQEPYLLRPANYPPRVPGKGYCIKETFPGETRVAVLNISGRVFMPPLDCPFQVIDKCLKEMKADVVIVDFHAEATSEKMAMGWYLDGRVSAVIGTHTHVQTADERVLHGGTAYITDAGMTGPLDSIIGVEKEPALNRFLLGMPAKFHPAREDLIFCGVIIEVNEKTGKAAGISRLQIPAP
ncbi:MAG: TIGR00282 family metallophosphoesterase [bacterium]